MSTPTPWRSSLDLLAEPPSEIAWLVDGVLPADSVVLLSGREGTMKTWLAMDCSRAVAEGATWLGRECEAGAVLYLDAEMPGNVFVSRLRAIGGSRNLNVWRWQDEGFPSVLTNIQLVDAAKSHRLIVVDTLRRFMGKREENSSTEMAEITKALRELTRYGATVLVLHHAKKDGERPGYRGSTELGAGVDIAMHVEKTKNDDGYTLRLITNKTRYDKDFEPVLRVEAGADRPIFHDASAEAREAAQTALASDLDQLGAVIAHLYAEHKRSPNQSQIIEGAKERGLGSRNTLLGWLRQGEGTRWQSELDGRSRVYIASVQLSTCSSPRGEGGLDNGSEGAEVPGNGECAPLASDVEPETQGVHLSSGPDTRGEDRLDNSAEPCTQVSTVVADTEGHK